MEDATTPSLPESIDPALPEEDLHLLAELGREIFPASPSAWTAGHRVPNCAQPATPTDQKLQDELRRLLIRRRHAKQHAWTEQRQAAAPAAAPEAAANNAETAKGLEDISQQRIPREADAAWLQQAISIKDALLRQMEASLLLPPPDQATIVGLSRRAAALVANTRRREAVLALKLKALTKELDCFRARELKAAQINAGLRQRLTNTLRDQDAVSLRREVRTLRTDLRAALDREAVLQRELLMSREQNEIDSEELRRTAAAEREMRRSFDYYRDIAYVHGQARHALGGR